MKPTRKSGKKGRVKEPRKRTATGTRPARPATTGPGRAEDALKESEEKYKLLIEATNTCYVIIDVQGRVLDANEEYVRITGHGSFADIAGRAVTEWTAPYDLERNAAEVRKCMERGSVRNLVIDYIGPQGRVTPVEINATMLQGPRSPRIFTVCRDITERKRAEEAVRVSEERARSIIESIPVGMHLYRLEDDGRLVFTGANPAADAILGVDNNSFIGKTIEEAFPSLKATEIPQRYREAAASGKAWHTEQVNYHDGAIQGAFEVHAFQTAPKTMVAAFEDITRRKQMEESLHASESRYKAIVDSQAEFVVRYQPGGIISFVNDTLCRYTNMKREDLLGRSYYPFMHPDDRGEFVRRIEALDRKNPSMVAEARMVLPDGRGSWHQWTHHAIFDERGDLVEYQSTGRDMTDIKEAEDRLRASESRFRALFENLNVVALVMDPSDGRILDANDAAATYYGWPRERLREMLISQINTMPHDEILRRMDQVKSRKKASFLLQHRRADGSLRNVEVHSGPILFEGRTALYSVIHDVTERRQAEDALRESEEKFSHIFRKAPLLITLSELESGRYLDVNERFLEISGFARDEVVGRTAIEIGWISEDQRSRMVQTMRERGGVSGMELSLRRKDGADVVCLYNGEMITVGGAQRLLSIAQDITERKRAEEELREKEGTYRSLFESANDGIFIQDETGFLDCNQKGADMYRLPKEKLIGRLPAEFAPERQPDGRFSSTVAGEKIQAALNGIPQVFEWQPVRADGSLFDVEITLSRLEMGGKMCLQAIVRDISERKREEARKREYAANLQRLLSVTREMTSTTDISRLYRVAVQTAKDLLHFDFSSVMVLSEDGNSLIIMDTIGFPASLIGQFRLVEGQGLSTYVIKRKQPDAVLDFSEETRFDVPPLIREHNIRCALCVPMMIEGSVFGVLIGHALAQRTFSPEDITLYQSIANQAAVAIKHAMSLHALAKNEQMLQTIIATEPDCIKVIDEESRLIMMNRAGLSMLQADSLEQVKGQVVCPLIAPGYQEAFMDMTRKVFQGGSGRLEFQMVGMRGRQLWLETHAVPLRNEKDEITALLGVTRDITERKRAEEELRENQARLDLALQSAHMGVWRWEIREDRRYFDDLASQLLGIDAATFAGTAEEFFRAVHPEDRERVKAALSRTVEQDVPYEPEYRVVWPEGSIHHITARGRLVRDDRGQPARINGILWDITEQRLLEEERLRAQKLESIGTLAGGIAHDFNNLLQGVFGYISMAKLTHDQKEKSLAMLEQAEKALHQSVSLTSQLLTFSKGGKPLKKAVDLRPVIEDAVKFALSGSRVTYDLSLSDDLCAVEADAGQIGQVVQNIVLNAEQAMPLGGRIEIAARNVPASRAAGPLLTAADGLVEITVRDQGTGIPPEHLPRIFDPYFTTKEKGSGLGLATSYSIIKNHDGVINVSSELGRGSTFTICLPAAGREAEGTARPAAPRVARKGRILVMDDEDLVRKVAYELLTGLGHHVELAGHGDEAVEKYRQAMAAGKPFDVVILDLTVRGGMGGLETLQKLREIDPDVKAVVSSGYSDDEVVATYRQYGFRSFLKKPYDIQELGRILDDVMA
jgi:two-component system, cell cycle sensor histidine kinase and response regulator CckA